MANEVVENGRKVWIQDERGVRITRKYSCTSYYKETCYLEIRYLNKIIILNIETGKELLKVSQTSLIDYLNEFFFRVEDDIYYSSGEIFIRNVSYAREIFNDIILVKKTNEDLTTIIYKDYIHTITSSISIFEEFFIVYDNGKLITYDKNFKELGSNLIEAAEKYEITTNDYTIIVNHIKDKCCFKQEILSVPKLNRILEPIYNKKFYICYSRSLGNECIEVTDINTENITIYNIVTGNIIYYGSKEDTEKINDEYMFIIDKERVLHLLEKHGELLSGMYSGINLSKNKDFFIIKNGDLMGVAKYTGEIIIEPYQKELFETPEGFYYPEFPLIEVKKFLEK